MQTEFKVPTPGIKETNNTTVFQRGNKVFIKVSFKDESLVSTYRENKWNEEEKKDDTYNFFRIVEVPLEFNDDVIVKFKSGLFTVLVTLKQPRFIPVIDDE